jgi:hypothetical protein
MYQSLLRNEEVTILEARKEVNLNITVFRDMTPCILEESCQYFGEACCLHPRP